MQKVAGSTLSEREDDSTRTLHVLLCPNAFKGSLTARQAAEAMAEGLRRAAGERVRFVSHLLPLADGGDGTLATLLDATGGTRHVESVSDPLGRPIAAVWGRLGSGSTGIEMERGAVIEMALASGLALLRPEECNPAHTSTSGTGQLMQAALTAGCQTLYVGIGGSATNDGGAGMAQALGARFLDAQGRELPPGGAALGRLEHIDLGGFRWPEGVRVIAACDVDNPLCGPQGASAIYGPQKGADLETVQELDAALWHYADVIERDLGVSVREVPGAGAAGGLGAGLLAFCRAQLLPGTEMILNAVGFEAALAACDLVVTGEGRLDGQTTRGKVIAGVCERARKAGKPVVALAGAVTTEAEAALREKGLTAALGITASPCTLEEAMRDGYCLLAASMERGARLFTMRL